MQVVNHYLYLPGCCGLCNSSNLPTIDTGISLDWPNSPDSPNPSANTQFYVCADCAIELARMVVADRGLTLVKDDAVPVLNEMVANLSQQNVDLAARMEELENALRVVQSIKPAPASSPAKKNFKVVSNPEGETEV